MVRLVAARKRDARVADQARSCQHERARLNWPFWGGHPMKADELDLCFLSATEALEKFQSRELSPVEL